MGKGILQFFCPVLKVKREERLSLSNSDACHSYITIIHIYFISRSFDTGSYRFLSGEKSMATWYVHARDTRVPYQSNVIIRSDVPNRLPRGSRLHLSNSVFVCRGISWIRLFSLSLSSLPPGEIVCKSFPSRDRLQTNAGSFFFTVLFFFFSLPLMGLH